MDRQPTKQGVPPKAEPLNQFSECHSGIMTRLADLGRLPALLEPAARARRSAGELLAFFREVIFEHHDQEEKELFPAVVSSAARGDEQRRVRELVDHLTREHRQIEAAWIRLEPALREIVRGRDASLDTGAVEALVRSYQDHASFEERDFLPLSEAILGRDGRHMAALGMSLHMRHALRNVLSRNPGHI